MSRREYYDWCPHGTFNTMGCGSCKKWRTLETALATARKERDEAQRMLKAAADDRMRLIATRDRADLDANAAWAVVAAAKAWAEWRMGYGGALVHETEDALFDAVAALTPPPAEDK